MKLTVDVLMYRVAASYWERTGLNGPCVRTSARETAIIRLLEELSAAMKLLLYRAESFCNVRGE